MARLRGSSLPRLSVRPQPASLSSWSPPALLVFLQAGLDHVGDEVAERPPVLIGDGEEVFENALGEGDGGALSFALQELERCGCGHEKCAPYMQHSGTRCHT
jgi:hypothetical protein